MKGGYHGISAGHKCSHVHHPQADYRGLYNDRRIFFGRAEVFSFCCLLVRNPFLLLLSYNAYIIGAIGGRKLFVLFLSSHVCMLIIEVWMGSSVLLSVYSQKCLEIFRIYHKAMLRMFLNKKKSIMRSMLGLKE